MEQRLAIHKDGLIAFTNDISGVEINSTETMNEIKKSA
jgi:hypothetical protein